MNRKRNTITPNLLNEPNAIITRQARQRKNEFEIVREYAPDNTAAIKAAEALLRVPDEPKGGGHSK